MAPNLPHRFLLLCSLAAIGCAAPGGVDRDDFASDGGVPFGDGGPEGASTSLLSNGIAPEGTIRGAERLADGTHTITLAPNTDRFFRIETRPGEHVSVTLRVDPVAWNTLLAVQRWDGARPVELWSTQAWTAGIAPLSVVDQETPRTFWFRARATFTVTARLEIRRTSFTDGPRCTSGCTDFLQLPVPNDPYVDGYAFDPVESIPRYLFGRRDLLMFVRHAGREMSRRGYGPFVTSDISQWNGDTPGVDTGRPRHASHDGGRDIDLTLYGADGRAPWRSYCTTTSDSRSCVPGTVTNFTGYQNADLLAGLYSSNRVTRVFLDTELIRHVRAGVEADDRIPSSIRHLFYDGVHLQHWSYHHDHLHIRFAE